MRRIRRAPVVLCAAWAALSVVSGAAAEETESNAKPSLESVERDLAATRERERRLAAEAEAQIRDIETLRTQLAATALAIQDSEASLSDSEARLTVLDEEETTRTRELTRRQSELADLLGALQRLARHPPEALIFLPTPPLDTVRTAKLLAAVVPPLEAEAKQVAAAVADLQGVRDQVATERQAQVAAAARLAAERDRLSALVARRGQLFRQTEAQRAETGRHAEALTRQAADLRDLLRRLDEPGQRPARDNSTVEARVATGLAGRLRNLGEARGQMAYPVSGRVLAAYGQTGDGGQPTRGLLIGTRAEAQVVAPFDGQVVFAGPFRGYGRILIIEHGGGYHSLLAGLGRIDVAVGHAVALGEPVAITSGGDLAGAAELGNAGPVLYLELRRHGQPINPMPWLAPSNGKVSG